MTAAVYCTYMYCIPNNFIKIKRKTKIPRITDEEWNSQKVFWPSGAEEEKTPACMLIHPKLSPCRFSSLYVGLFYRVGIGIYENGVLENKPL